MKPFDLKKALAGEPVVTKDGRPVSQLIKFEALVEDGYVLYGVVNNKILNFLDSGKYDRTFESHSLDLFMAEPERWVNIHFDPKDGHIFYGVVYQSETDALQDKDKMSYYQATIKLKDYKHEK
jgi:hypothetical protein